MKRYIGICMALAAVFTVLSGCGSRTENASVEPGFDIAFSMWLIEADQSGARVGFLNETDRTMEYGEAYWLEVLEDGEWTNVPYILESAAFTAVAYDMPKGQEKEWETDWEWLYGALEPGHYRLTKEVMDFRGTGDYTIYPFRVEFDVREASEAPVEEILTAPPTLALHDALSSTYASFESAAGTYTWNWQAEKADEMWGVAACGQTPMETAKGLEPLELPRYNKLDYVPYSASWEVMPDRVSVTEYDAGDIGNTESEILSMVVYDESFLMEWKPDRVYAVEAEWDEAGFKERGFYGTASYVIVTK